VADQDGLAQVEVLDQRAQVGGEGVVVVADRGLAGVPEPAAVIGDHAVAGFQQDRDLLVPGPAAERVAVDQHHRLSGAVVLVVNLDGVGVLLPDGDLCHCLTFLLVVMASNCWL